MCTMSKFMPLVYGFHNGVMMEIYTFLSRHLSIGAPISFYRLMFLLSRAGLCTMFLKNCGRGEGLKIVLS